MTHSNAAFDRWHPQEATSALHACADTCVWGAVCAGAKDDGSMSGICTPVVKGTDTAVQVASPGTAYCVHAVLALALSATLTVHAY